MYGLPGPIERWRALREQLRVEIHEHGFATTLNTFTQTYGESGFRDFHSATFVGFFAPDKTPDAVVTRLHAQINDILKEPEAQQKLKTLGFDAINKSHAEAVDYFRGEVATWEKMSKAIGYSTD